MTLSLEIDIRERDLAKSLTALCELYNTENASKKDFAAVSFDIKTLDRDYLVENIY